MSFPSCTNPEDLQREATRVFYKRASNTWVSQRPVEPTMTISPVPHEATTEEPDQRKKIPKPRTQTFNMYVLPKWDTTPPQREHTKWKGGAKWYQQGVKPKCARGVKPWKYRYRYILRERRVSQRESHEPWSTVKMKQVAFTHKFGPLNEGWRKKMEKIQRRTEAYPLNTFSRERTAIQNSSDFPSLVVFSVGLLWVCPLPS